MPTRQEVYKIVDLEREFQDKNNQLLGYQINKEPFKVGEEITLLQNYVAKAVQQWTNNAGDAAALHEIRKIAAIAVRCLENHGAPPR